MRTIITIIVMILTRVLQTVQCTIWNADRTLFMCRRRRWVSQLKRSSDGERNVRSEERKDEYERNRLDGMHPTVKKGIGESGSYCRCWITRCQPASRIRPRLGRDKFHSLLPIDISGKTFRRLRPILSRIVTNVYIERTVLLQYLNLTYICLGKSME